MLLVNKKLIDDNSKVGQWIKNKVLEYQDRDKPIEFESYMEKFPKRFTYTETGQPTARREETQGVWIGSQENFTIPEVGKVTINWVRDLPEIKSDGTYDVKKTLIGVRKGRLKVYPKQDPDKAFFLCEISSVVKNGEVTVIDREADDQKELDKISDTSMVEYMVGNPSSPIAPEVLGSDNILRDLAAGWGVINSENAPLSTLRKQLIINVKQSHKNKEKTKRGFDEFVNDMNALQKGGDNAVKIRKDIQLALENKKLLHEENKVILFPGTDVQRELFKHRPTEVGLWKERLLDYLLANPKVLEELREELNFEEKMSNEDKNRNFEDLNLNTKIEQVGNMRWPQAFKIYKDLGFKKEDIPKENRMDYIKNKIIERYKETGS